MQLVVSLCNLPQPDASGLLLLRTERAGGISRVDIGASPAQVRGCSGLWLETDLLYCAWTGIDWRPRVSVLQLPSLELLEVGEVEDVRDVHSICVLDGFLYLTSTATDEIRRVPARAPGGRSASVWRASSAGVDTHHVNSILPVDGTILSTAFGPRTSERWSSAQSGYVVDIGSGRLLASGIEHPHSLALAFGRVHLAESRRRRVRDLSGRPVTEVDGYARGLCACGPEVVIGVSRGRARSRSLGTIENAADPGEPDGQTGVVLTAQGGTAIERFHDLSEFGTEVYDVVVLRDER